MALLGDAFVIAIFACPVLLLWIGFLLVRILHVLETPYEEYYD